MKYFISDSQIKFFDENSFIEFEDVFLENDLNILNSEIDKLTSFDKSSFIENLKNSRDLFRKSQVLKKIILNNKIISIIKHLSKEPQVRLAFDQFILTNAKNPFDEMELIDDFFSIQGLLLIYIIKLDETIDTINENDIEEKSLLPKNEKNIIFLKHTSFLNFKKMFEKQQRFLIVGFSNFNTIYKPGKKDPNSSFLKTFGYNIGDRLKNSTHPLIY